MWKNRTDRSHPHAQTRKPADRGRSHPNKEPVGASRLRYPRRSDHTSCRHVQVRVSALGPRPTSPTPHSSSVRQYAETDAIPSCEVLQVRQVPRARGDLKVSRRQSGVAMLCRSLDLGSVQEYPVPVGVEERETGGHEYLAEIGSVPARMARGVVVLENDELIRADGLPRRDRVVPGDPDNRAPGPGVRIASDALIAATESPGDSWRDGGDPAPRLDR